MELTTTLKGEIDADWRHATASQIDDHAHKHAESNAQEPVVEQESTVMTYRLVKLQDSLDRKAR